MMPYMQQSQQRSGRHDPNNIFILGHSQGAGTMPRILSKAPSSLVRGSILLAPPARPLTDIAIDQYEYLGASKEEIDELKRQAAFIQGLLSILTILQLATILGHLILCMMFLGGVQLKRQNHEKSLYSFCKEHVIIK